MGRRLLRMWLMRPILKMEDLEDRQEAIQTFMHFPDVCRRAQVRFPYCEGVQLPLWSSVNCLSKTFGVQGIMKGIRDVPKLLMRLKSTQTLPNPKDFSLLLDCISNLILLRDLILSLGAELEREQLHSAQGVYE
jgi:DNA mismatch repair ATPase MutS